MTDEEIIELINSLAEQKIKSIESINNTDPNKVIVIGLNNAKLIEYTLFLNGDFSYKFIGTKLRNL
jgi:hypothetical protein